MFRFRSTAIRPNTLAVQFQTTVKRLSTKEFIFLLTLFSILFMVCSLSRQPPSAHFVANLLLFRKVKARSNQ